MYSRTTRATLALVAALLLASLLAGCGTEAPTELPPPTATEQQAEATEPATDTTFDSPFDSPLTEPTSPPAAVEIDPGATPSPTGTPDPGYTPVAIIMAELEPGREVITIQNISMVDQDISGWTLFNLDAEPTFRFPGNLVLKPGDTVQVYSAVSEGDVPEGAYFWTEDKMWTKFPADILLLNQVTRLVYWYVAYD